VFFKLIKVLLLVSELCICQNARWNDKKKCYETLHRGLEVDGLFGLIWIRMSTSSGIFLTQ